MVGTSTKVVDTLLPKGLMKMVGLMIHNSRIAICYNLQMYNMKLILSSLGNSGRRPQQSSSYRRDEGDRYGSQESSSHRQETADSYGGGRGDHDTYGTGRQQVRDDQYGPAYGTQTLDERRATYGSGRQDAYGSGRQGNYESDRQEAYGRGSHTSASQRVGSERNEGYDSGRGANYEPEGRGGYNAGGFDSGSTRDDTYGSGAAASYYSEHKERKYDDNDEGRYGSGGHRAPDSDFHQPSTAAPYRTSYNSPEDTLSGSRHGRDEGGFRSSYQTQPSGFERDEYSSNTPGRGQYVPERGSTFGDGNDDDSKRGKHRGEYDIGSRHEEQHQREGRSDDGGNKWGGDRPQLGRQEREREQELDRYGGDTYRSSEYGREQEPSSYGRRGGGYGGDPPYERKSRDTEHSRTDYGYGHSTEKEEKKKHGGRSDDSDDSSPKHGRNRRDDNDNPSSARSGYSQGEYGSGGGYGGYGGQGETFGAERLKLNDDSDDEKKRRRHKKHNDYD